ncbi:hypothetical protein [Enterococcus alishanensis]
MIAFDNINLSMMTTPQLTAMPRPAYDLGFQACEVLKGEISNDNYKKKSN